MSTPILGSEVDEVASIANHDLWLAWLIILFAFAWKSFGGFTDFLNQTKFTISHCDITEVQSDVVQVWCIWESQIELFDLPRKLVLHDFEWVRRA